MLKRFLAAVLAVILAAGTQYSITSLFTVTAQADEEHTHTYITVYIYDGTEYSSTEWWENTYDAEKKDYVAKGKKIELPCDAVYTITTKCSICGEVASSLTITKGHTNNISYTYEGVNYTSDEWQHYTYDSKQQKYVYTGKYTELPCEAEYTQVSTCEYCGNVSTSKLRKPHDLTWTHTYDGKEYSDSEWLVTSNWSGKYTELKCGEPYTNTSVCSVCGEVKTYDNTKPHGTYVSIYTYDGKDYKGAEWYLSKYDSEKQETVYSGKFFEIPCGSTYTFRSECPNCGDVSSTYTYTKNHVYSSVTYTYDGKDYTQDEWQKTTYDSEQQKSVNSGKFYEIPCGSEYTKTSVCEYCKDVKVETSKKSHNYCNIYTYEGKEYSASEWQSNSMSGPIGKYYELACGTKFDVSSKCSYCGYISNTYTSLRYHTYETTYKYEGKEYSETEWKNSTYDNEQKKVVYNGKYYEISCGTAFIKNYKCTNCDYAYSETTTKSHTTSYTYEYEGTEYTQAEWKSSTYDYSAGKPVNSGKFYEIPCGTEYTMISRCSECDYTRTFTQTTDHSYANAYYTYDGTDYESSEWYSSTYDSEKQESVHSGKYFEIPCGAAYTLNYKCSYCDHVKTYEYTKPHNDTYTYVYDGKEYSSDEWLNYNSDTRKTEGIYVTLPCDSIYTIRKTCSECGSVRESQSKNFHTYTTEYIVGDKTYTSEEWYDTGSNSGLVYSKLPCGTTYTTKSTCSKCGGIKYLDYTKTHIGSSVYIYNGTEYNFTDWSYISEELPCGANYTKKTVCSNCGEISTNDCTKEHALNTVYIVDGKEYSASEFVSYSLGSKGSISGIIGLDQTLPCGTNYVKKLTCINCNEVFEENCKTDHHGKTSYIVDGKTYSSNELIGMLCGTKYTEVVECDSCGKTIKTEKIWHNNITSKVVNDDSGDGYKVVDYCSACNTIIDNVTSGDCGENTSWTFDSTDGEMTISGNGSMDSADFDNIKADIKKVTIESGVTSIAASAFEGCSSITSIEIPATVTSIGASAFEGCSSLTDIYFNKAAADITIAADAFKDIASTITIHFACKYNDWSNTNTSSYMNAANITLAEDHDLVKTDAKDATCTAAGNSEYYTCQGCGKYFSDAEGKKEIAKDSWIIPAKAHTLVKTDAVEATCLTDGNSEYFTCQVCSKYFSDAEGKTEIEKDSWIIKALGHKEAMAVRENEVGTSCTEPGSYDSVVYCERCHIELSREHKDVDVLGHNFVNYVSNGDATCTEDGTKTAKCERCDATNTVVDEGSKLPHKLVKTEAKKATSAENGNSEYYTCQVCSKYFSDAEGKNEIEKDSWIIPKLESVSMFRLYNPNTGEHLYSSLQEEVDFLTPLGWQYEGVAWEAPKTSDKPVYRLYNPNSGDHHYTMNNEEKDWLVSLGWTDEGVAWYSGGDVPVYRLFNPNALMATHHYTAFTVERDWLFTIGWKDEDVAWYAISIPEN